MKIYVGVTDNDWFEMLASLGNVDEVNFWKPSPKSPLSALERGELFLFKLRSPRNCIAGGGVYYTYKTLPISLAWEAFSEKNGAPSFVEMRNHILKRRSDKISPWDDFKIGCYILTQPFFFDESDVFSPPDWHSSIQTGKYYSLDTEAGKYIWKRVWNILHKRPLLFLDKSGKQIAQDFPRYGKEQLISPRLGQGAFRVEVTDAYRSSCAITNEKIMPVLEAAHIKPYGKSGPHAVNNGVLLRSDVHKLFDVGYLTITPDQYVEVSRRIKEEFENGKYYYTFHGKPVNKPLHIFDQPSREFLQWHNEEKFRG